MPAVFCRLGWQVVAAGLAVSLLGGCCASVMDPMKLWFNSPRDLPNEIVAGADAASVRRVGTLRLTDLAPEAPAGTDASIFQVELAEGQMEWRVLLENSRTRQSAYVGALTYQFTGMPAPVLLFQLGETRFILGHVDASVAGQLRSVDLVHPHASKDYLGSVKTTLVTNRFFCVPILAAEAEQWTAISEASIQTKESLAQLRDPALSIQPGSGSAWYALFAPPLEIEALFIAVELVPAQ